MIMILSDIQKDYATAIKHLESYDFFSDISPEEKLNRLHDYACLYEDYGQYDKSRELLKRAIDFSLESEPELRDTRLPINYIKYILSYYDNGLQDSIPNFAKEVNSRLTEYPYLQTRILLQSSGLLTPQNAINLINEEIEKYPAIKNDTSYTYILLNIAEKYFMMDDYDNSIGAADKAISISKEKYPEVRKILYRERFSFYKDTVYSNYIKINDEALKALEEGVNNGTTSEEYRALIYRRFMRALRAKKSEEARAAYNRHYKLLKNNDKKWVLWPKTDTWLDSPFYSMSLHGSFKSSELDYAELCFLEGDKASAKVFIMPQINSRKMDASDIIDYTISNKLDILSSYKQTSLDFMTKWAVKLEDDSIAKAAYDMALGTKQLKLTTVNNIRDIIAKSDNKEIKDRWNELTSIDDTIRQRIAKNLPVDELIQRQKSLQKSLFVDANQIGDFSRSFNVGWKDVSNMLKEGDCAVEFTSYTEEDDTETYCALILETQKTPKIIKLFNTKDLKINNTSSLDTTYYNAIWKPVIASASNVRNIYFSPHGLLHMLPLEYLRMNASEYMQDKFNMHRLSSTRNLCNIDNKDIKDAVVFGGIDYDANKDKEIAIHNKENIEKNRDLLDFIEQIGDEERAGVSYLPGTKIEADTISSMLTRKFDVKEFSGSEATETSIKNISGKPTSILHIATHGFYISPDKTQKKKNDALRAYSENENLSQDDRNMSRSGILFSGANNTLKGIRQSPEDDGILTAKEVSQMDLKGTQLVVLSACQSALGEVSGEGVFGLQRGFKMAGVETILMSLWKVSDTATRILMTKFYKGLMEGKTKRQSLLAAQKYLMEYEMPDKTGKSTGKPFSHPRYWAAFVLLDAL